MRYQDKLQEINPFELCLYQQIPIPIPFTVEAESVMDEWPDWHPEISPRVEVHGPDTQWMLTRYLAMVPRSLCWGSSSSITGWAQCT